MKKALSIVNNPAGPINDAQCVNNVVLQKNGIEFYGPETLHTSPFYDKVVPMLIVDLVACVNPVEIYGVSGMNALKKNVVLVKNHPLRKVKVSGRILDFSIKDARFGTFYVLVLDDSSGGGCLNIKVSEGIILSAGAGIHSLVGLLVEVTGLCSLYNGAWEISSDSMIVLDNSDNSLVAEIWCWQEALEFRKVLRSPWIQTMQALLENDKISAIDNALPQRNVSSRERDNHGRNSEGEASQTFVLNSNIYIRNKTIEPNGSKELEPLPETDVFGSDLEEITELMFESVKSFISSPLYIELHARIQNWQHFTSMFSYNQWFKQLSVEHFQFEFLKWTFKKKSIKFSLNEAFKDPGLSELLTKMAKHEFPKQVIDLTVPDVQIKTIVEIKGELFHNARHNLQLAGLIRCTKRKRCHASSLISFVENLQKELKNLKDLNKEGKSLGLVLANFELLYNHANKKRIELGVDLFIPLVYWLVRPMDGRHWLFDSQDQILTYRIIS